MSLERLVDILDRHGIGGADMRALADDVLGERDPDSGLRPGIFARKKDARDAGTTAPNEALDNEQMTTPGSESAGSPSGGGGASQSGGAKSGQAGSQTGASSGTSAQSSSSKSSK